MTRNYSATLLSHSCRFDLPYALISCFLTSFKMVISPTDTLKPRDPKIIRIWLGLTSLVIYIFYNSVVISKLSARTENHIDGLEDLVNFDGKIYVQKYSFIHNFLQTSPYFEKLSNKIEAFPVEIYSKSWAKYKEDIAMGRAVAIDDFNTIL